jgi:hypothetical protein
MMRVFYSRMTVLFLLLVPVVIELIVSLYKRDGMYTVWGTVGNSVSAFIGRFIALRIVTLYLGLYSLWGITTLFDLRMAHDNLGLRFRPIWRRAWASSRHTSLGPT